MAYIKPAISDLINRIPEFATVDPGFLNLALEEAISQIGDDWDEKDRARAQIYLAAHWLSLEGEPNRSSNGASTAFSGPVVGRKVGPVSETYAQPAFNAISQTSQSLISDFRKTAYGLAYLRLLRKNVAFITTS